MSLRYETLFVLLVATGMDACAMSRMAQAEVQSAYGVPCFTISLKEENRNGQPLLGALSVSDLSGKPATDTWSFFMTGGRKIPLSSTSCLRYGELPEGAKTAASMPAPELQTGRVYSIFLNGRPNDPSDPTYGYRGKFCIVVLPSGDREIIAIDSDTQAWKDEVCPSSPPSR